MGDPVFVHIVTFNSDAYIQKAVDAVIASTGDIHLHITDNASSDKTVEILKSLESEKVTVTFNAQNLGFSGAHNQGVTKFLGGKRRYLLVLNPDVVLEPDCIEKLVEGVKSGEFIGLATPKLLRADDDLKAVEPRVLDAAGMMLVNSLRHFDRGSQEPDGYNTNETVFGGTGACLLLKRECAIELLLRGEKKDSLKISVFPQLAEGEKEREPLFDEAFFAYREDADLCWRSNLLGWSCLYVADAIGYHRRVVLPTNRGKTSAILNGLSVRNRFLLQVNNYFPFKNSLFMFIGGFFLRNLIVLLGVLLTEWRSVPYLLDMFVLLPRAFERRRILKEKMYD